MTPSIMRTPRVASVGAMTTELVDTTGGAAEHRRDDDAARWLTPLAGTGPRHAAAVRQLHELLVRAATYEVRRRASILGVSSSSELEDLAMQAADDALVAILARLDAFEQRSAFTTWAYKFAIHTAGVAVRRLAWREREIPSSDIAFEQLISTLPDPEAAAEQRERLDRLVVAIGALTPRQREVLLALCVSGVPIDVLADRLGSTRGALYKTLHDARRTLRARLEVASSDLPAFEGNDDA